jgi:hypothetical protein
MSLTPPEFFEPIRQAAERRWQQLEADPELAGPWHQLFKQVQSPRHVLSELLQNADDAGATEASAEIDNGLFAFSHNGEDFKSDHFASLCRFGYSNKRSLHTIGFRGIGFKSTFSLGPVVKIKTSSLSVYFEKERFTLPYWQDERHDHTQATRILVQIQDHLREAELQKNLAEWQQSPVSLLFFRNIRKLSLNGHELFWEHSGNGPASKSEWYSLNKSLADRYLLVRSALEDFPGECVDEIRQERILGADTDFSLPPSRVELVLGASAGLYVVLPTTVKPSLPFACNGPFMQDPARVKIKDPETSPTNRWLLSRMGKLAATTMSQWLSNQGLELKQRAEAYRLMPKGISSRQGLEGSCAQETERSFFDNLQDTPIVLSQSGLVETSGRCISLDKQARSIWSEEVFAQEIEPNSRRLICEEIPSEAIDTLYRMVQIDKISRSQLCSYLNGSTPPHPGNEKLLTLWVYLSGEFSNLRSSSNLEDAAIVPVTGKRTLQSPRTTVRLTQRKSALSEQDGDLLSSHILVLDNSWVEYLQSEGDEAGVEQGRAQPSSTKEVAAALLQRMGLSDGSDTTSIISKVVSAIGKKPTVDDNILIRLAWICARLDCRAPSNFIYLTQSGDRRHVNKSVCHDPSGVLNELLPEGFYSEHFISERYGVTNASCSADEWKLWLSSAKTGLRRLPPLAKKEITFKHSSDLLSHLKSHYQVDFNTEIFPRRWERLYPSQRYTLVDHDFPDELVAFWQQQDRCEEMLAKLVAFILEYSLHDWLSTPLLEIYQTNTSGLNEERVDGHGISASWLSRFQSTRCLPDTRGVLCKPSELLRRSEATEPLIGIERFIAKPFDTPSNEQLLSTFGVSAALPGPQLLLSLLRSLSKLDAPPLIEIVCLYEQLDKLIIACTDEDKSLIVQEFNENDLVCTEQGEWHAPTNVFISGDGMEPAGIQTVLSQLQHLSLWRQVDIPERPNAETAVEYIGSLRLGVELDSTVKRLVTALLKSFPQVVVSECEAWLTLAGRLQAFDQLDYGLSSNAITVDSFFDEILTRTADFRLLDGLGVHSLMSSVGLPALDSALSYELEASDEFAHRDALRLPWLEAFGLCVSRLPRLDEGNTPDYLRLGTQLRESRFCFRKEIRIIPMIDGKPAGTPISREGAITSDFIFANKLPQSRLANLIPVVLGEFLGSSELQAAASYCYERSQELVFDYFQANFNLVELPAGDKNPSSEAKMELAKDSAPAQSPPLLESLGQSSRYSDSSGKPTKISSGADAWQPSVLESINTPTSNQPDLGSSFSPFNPDSELLASFGTSELDASSQENSEFAGGLPHSVVNTLPEDETANVNQYSLIGNYALSLGMTEKADGFFEGRDSRKLFRRRGELFPWILVGPDGDAVKHFIVKAKPLVLAATELDSIAFGMLEKFPSSHSLLLPSTTGDVSELSGQELQDLIRLGRIKVFPASYRLAMV